MKKKSYRSAPKHSVASPEAMKTNTFYAITINPSNMYQCFESENRMIEFVQGIKEVFAKIGFDRYVQYELWVELSPLGRLHLHGSYYFESIENIYRFYLNVIDKLLAVGTVVTKDITDKEGWYAYCTKQSKMFSVRASGQPVIRTNMAPPTVVDMFKKKQPKKEDTPVRFLDRVLPVTESAGIIVEEDMIPEEVVEDDLEFGVEKDT